MSTTRDWLPSGRQDQLTMAKNWGVILNENHQPADAGKKSTTADLWNIPRQAVDDLARAAAHAETALTAAQNEETRTKVTNAQCKNTFDALIVKMQDIKKRYFYVPPLTEADLIALGLKIPDKTPTQSGAPTAEVTIETYLVGRHQLGIRCIYLTGSPADPANKGYRVYYKVVSQGETPPANPEELSKSFFTKRKKDVIDFEFDNSGKTAFFAVQVENEGRKGPWGPTGFCFNSVKELSAYAVKIQYFVRRKQCTVETVSCLELLPRWR